MGKRAAAADGAAAVRGVEKAKEQVVLADSRFRRNDESCLQRLPNPSTSAAVAQLLAGQEMNWSFS